MRAWLAVVHLGREAGFSTAELANALPLSLRGVRDLSTRDAAPEVLMATRRISTLLSRFGGMRERVNPESSSASGGGHDG